MLISWYSACRIPIIRFMHIHGLYPLHYGMGDYAVMHCDVTVKYSFSSCPRESERYTPWGVHRRQRVQGADGEHWLVRYLQTQMCGLRTDMESWMIQIYSSVSVRRVLQGQLWVLSGSLFTHQHIRRSIRIKIQSFSRWRRKIIMSMDLSVFHNN